MRMIPVLTVPNTSLPWSSDLPDRLDICTDCLTRTVRLSQQVLLILPLSLEFPQLFLSFTTTGIRSGLAAYSLTWSNRHHCGIRMAILNAHLVVPLPYSDFSLIFCRTARPLMPSMVIPSSVSSRLLFSPLVLQPPWLLVPWTYEVFPTSGSTNFPLPELFHCLFLNTSFCPWLPGAELVTYSVPL